MAKNESLIDLKIKINANEKEFIEKLAAGVENGVNIVFGKLAGSLGKQIGQKLQIELNTAVFDSLKGPIKVRLDVKRASEQVDSLVKRLTSAATQLQKLEIITQTTEQRALKANEGARVKEQQIAEKLVRDKQKQINDLEAKRADATDRYEKGSLTRQINKQTKELEDLIDRAEAAKISTIAAINATRESISGKTIRSTGASFTDKEEKKQLDINRKLNEGMLAITSFNKAKDNLSKSFDDASSIRGITNFSNKAKLELSKIEAEFDNIYESADKATNTFGSKQINRINALSKNIDKINNSFINTSEILKSSQTLVEAKEYEQLRFAIDSTRKSLIARGLTEKQVQDLLKPSVSVIDEYITKHTQIKELLNQEGADIKKITTLFNQLSNIKFETGARLKDIVSGKIGIAGALEENAIRDESIDKLLRSNVNFEYLDKLEEKLQSKKVQTQRPGEGIDDKISVPLNIVNKQLSPYDKSLVTLRRNLQLVHEEQKQGIITTAEAEKRYKALASEIHRLEIGIDQIDTTKLKQAFRQEELDPRKALFNLGILSFTLGIVGSQLMNFSRTLYTTFSQLAQFAEPIERVNNSLDKQVKDGLISVKQREEALARLRSIGDIPGSSVESANKTFEQLKRINLSLRERLDLTEGLAKLPSLTGGSPEDANQLANALTKAASRGKFEGENFQTLLAQGGNVVNDLFNRLGILGTADDINKFGVLPFIRELNKELVNTETPAATTTDRINRLKSRMSELGTVLGTVLAPGLDALNLALTKIVEVVRLLSEAYKGLPDSLKTFVSISLISIPIAVAFAGAILKIAATVGFAASGFKRIKQEGESLIGMFKRTSVAATDTATAVSAANTKMAISGTTANIAQTGGAGKIAVSGATTASNTAATLASSTPLVVTTTKATAKEAEKVAVGMFARIGGWLTKLGGIFNKVLGGVGKLLTNLLKPIGIVITLILSALFSFFTNFNGVQDRVYLAFSKLNTALTDLVNAFGADTKDGLWYILSGVGSALMVVIDLIDILISTIGNIVLDVFVSLVEIITDMVKTVTSVIDLLKKGEIFQAFQVGFTGVFVYISNFIKNLLINIIATLAESGASIIERMTPSWLPGREAMLKSGREAIDNLRKFNGTDKASIEADKKLRKDLQDQKTLQEQKEKDAEELAKREDELARENLNKRRLALSGLFEELRKADKDFYKIERETRKVQLDSRLKDIAEEARKTAEFFVKSLSFAITTTQASVIGSQSVSSIRNIYSKRREATGAASTIEAQQQLETIFDPEKEGVIKKLNEYKEAGGIEFNNILDVIDKIKKSTSKIELDNLFESLNKEADQLVRVKAFEDEIARFKRFLEGAKKKADLIYIKEQGNQDDLKRQEEEEIRAAKEKVTAAILAIRMNDLEAKNAEENEKEQLDRRLDDINRRKQAEIDARNKVSESTKKQTELQAELNKLLNEEKDKADDLNNKKEQARLTNEKVLADIKNAGFSSADTIKLIAEANAAYEQTLNRLDSALTRNTASYKKLRDATTALYKEQQKTINLDYIGRISDMFLQISQLGNRVVSTVKDVLNKISLGVSDNPLSMLTNAINELVSNGLLSRASSEFSEFISIIFDLGQNSITTAEAIERFNAVLSNSRFSQIKKEFNDALGEYNNSLLENSDRRISENATPEDISNIINSQFITGGLYDSIQEKLDAGIISPALAKLLESAKNTGATPLELIQLIQKNYKNTEQFKMILGQMTESTNVSSETVLKQLNLYNLKVKEVQELTEEEISDLTQKIENTSKIKSREIEDSTLIKQGQLYDVNSKLETEEDDKEILKLQRQKFRILKEIEDLNYQKLDAEIAYQAQKDIINAKGNSDEIARILKHAKLERRKLLEEHAITIKELAKENNANTDKDGNLLDENGKSLQLVIPVVLKTIPGDKTKSNILVNGTSPDEDGNKPKEGLSPIEAAIRETERLNEAMNNGASAANRYMDALTQLWENITSGKGVLENFTKWITKTGKPMDNLGESFRHLALFGIGAFVQAMGDALVSAIVNGDNFLKSLGKMFGDMLIMLGKSLFQLGLVSLALSALALIPFLRPIVGDPELSIAGAAIAMATGVGLMLAGKALGGGGSSSASVSNTGTANSAGASAGTSGEVNYDPESDPKLMYQRALRTEIYLDIKSDDSQIIKSIIRQTNRNPKLNTLIGNRSLNFVL